MENTLVGLLVAIIVFGIPGAALAIRWVLRPLLAELTSAVLSVRGVPEEETQRRIDVLEDQLVEMERRLERALEASEFHRALGAGETAGGEPPRVASSAAEATDADQSPDGESRGNPS